MGMLAWRDDWAGLAQVRRNLYGDLAFWQIYAASNYERFCHDLRYNLDVAGSDSVLFGSDGPSAIALMPNEDFIQILRDLPQKAPLGVRFTKEEVEGILGGNAKKVFGI
jgi:predicted TIM-barrel fold metal-dependent hydrolase